MSPSRWQRLACFADTSFFYALVDAGDRWHDDCVQLLQHIQQQGRLVVCTPLVIAETHTLILHRIGYPQAIHWVSMVEQWAEAIEVTPEQRKRAVEILTQYADQSFTYTDAVSFAVIETQGLKIALSCDKHFLAFGGDFVTLPLSGTHLPAL
ncbi:MAG: PIN domain-containing protein [Fimbriimonadales bacterium]|nr:PIN domain-containing protein [Fimbriimonadales bacterium]